MLIKSRLYLHLQYKFKIYIHLSSCVHDGLLQSLQNKQIACEKKDIWGLGCTPKCKDSALLVFAFWFVYWLVCFLVCLLYLFDCCIGMLHLFMCCIDWFVAFVCLLHLFACCICLFVAFVSVSVSWWIAIRREASCFIKRFFFNYRKGRRVPLARGWVLPSRRHKVQEVFWLVSVSPVKLKVSAGKKVLILILKQDHQRWGYITVTHMEQPAYLAIWKDLNKKKRKEHKKKIEQ